MSWAVMEGIPALFPQGAQTGEVDRQVRTARGSYDLSHSDLVTGPGGWGSQLQGCLAPHPGHMAGVRAFAVSCVGRWEQWLPRDVTSAPS